MLLLETGKRPLETQALKRMYTYIMKVEAGCTPQETKKSKLLTSSLIQDIRIWFAKWNVEAYMDKPIVQGKEGECMLKFNIAILESLHTK